MLRKVTEFVEKYNMIEEGDLVAAGVSGGADSLCLLFMLLELQKKISFDLVVVHVNHMIREEAGSEAEFVKNICEKENIPFYLQEAAIKDLAKKEKISEEEAGRKVRYQAFNEALKIYGKEKHGKEKIAVAHHQGDSAETLLFHLFRGTGVWGMAGILPVNNKIIRPLLCCSRQEIEEYLRGQEKKWCIDITNEEDLYTRNKIRHHILPYAEEQINEKATEHLAQAALQMAELRNYLEIETKKVINEVKIERKGEWGISIDKLMNYPAFMQNQCVLWFLNEKMPGRRDITAEHIQAVCKLFQKDGSKKLDLPGKLEVVKEYGTLWIKQKKEKVSVEKSKTQNCMQEEKNFLEISLEKSQKYILKNKDVLEITFINKEDFRGIEEKKYTKYLDYDKINNCLKLRFRQSGDYLVINEQGQKKLLKEYFIHEKIPAGFRDEIPLVAEENHILWIIGYRISAYYKVTDKTKKIIQMKLWRDEHGREN